MMLAEADAIARTCHDEDGVISHDRVVPSVLSHNVVDDVAQAVAAAAQTSGVARRAAAVSVS